MKPAQAKDSNGFVSRSNPTQATERQYDHAAEQDLAQGIHGYGKSVIQAMYGYRQTASIQSKGNPPANTTLASPQKQTNQIQCKEHEHEELQVTLSPINIQKKLTIGSPDDHYEKEADYVVNQVMQMPKPAMQRKCAHCEAEEQLLKRKSPLTQNSIVHRKCAACEAEEGILPRKSIASSISPLVQAKAEPGGIASETVSQQIQSRKGGGNPMHNSTQSFMENRFGTDFSSVRIHTDAQAIQLSQQLNAQAFTTGNDIYFNQGKYSPESSEGKHLLAHELTHVVQQGSLQLKKQESVKIQTKPGVKVPDMEQVPEWTAPLQQEFQWQNQTLREKIYPQREQSLRAFLEIVKEMELAGYLNDSSADTDTSVKKLSGKERSGELKKYIQELKEKDHEALLQETINVFNKWEDSLYFPPWVRYMVIHYSGMRYESAHSTWRSPQELLSILKDREVNIADESARQTMIGKGLEEFKKEPALNEINAKKRKSIKSDLKSSGPEAVEKRLPGKDRVPYAELQKKETTLFNLYASLPQLGNDPIAFAQTQDSITALTTEIENLQENFSEKGWKIITKAREDRMKTLQQIYVEIAKSRLQQLADSQALFLLNQMHQDGQIPEPVWKEITSFTELRLQVQSQDELIDKQNRGLKNVPVSDDFDATQLKTWKTLLKLWYDRSDGTAWRSEHKQSLSPSLVTSVVCDQLGTKIQNIRGVRAPGGLRKNAMAFADAAEKTPASTTPSWDRKNACPPEPGQAFFKKPTDLADFPCGSAIFWAQWSELQITKEYKKVYDKEEKPLHNKINRLASEKKKIIDKKTQTEKDKKRLAEIEKQLPELTSQLAAVKTKVDSMEIFLPEKDKTPDISNVVSPFEGSEPDITEKGAAITDGMKDDSGWTYSVNDTRIASGHPQRKDKTYVPVKSIMRVKPNPFYCPDGEKSCTLDFSEKKDKKLLKQWLIWKHQATVMFVLPHSQQVITYDTSGKFDGAEIKGMTARRRSLNDLIDPDAKVFVGFSPAGTPDSAPGDFLDESKILSKPSTKTSIPVQPKLSTSLSNIQNDNYEREADAVADRVTAMTASTVQRKCAVCQAEEGLLQRKTISASFTPFVQAKTATESTASETVSQQIQSRKGGGNPMHNSTQSFMENRFGTDFSGVRIHTDAQAIQLSQQLNAQAFTTGNDIYFNQGKYSPESPEGKHLLAHELTHVVQQNAASISPKIQRYTDETGNVLPDPFELTWGKDKFSFEFHCNEQENKFNVSVKYLGPYEVEGVAVQDKASTYWVHTGSGKLQSKIQQIHENFIKIDLYSDGTSIVKLADEISFDDRPDFKGRKHSINIYYNGKNIVGNYMLVKDPKASATDIKPAADEEFPGELPATLSGIGKYQAYKYFMKIDGDGDQYKDLLLGFNVKDYWQSDTGEGDTSPKTLKLFIRQLSSDTELQAEFDLPKPDVSTLLFPVIDEVTDGKGPTKIKLLHPATNSVLTITPPVKTATNDEFIAEIAGKRVSYKFPAEKLENIHQVAHTGKIEVLGNILAFDVRLGPYNDNFRLTFQPLAKDKALFGISPLYRGEPTNAMSAEVSIPPTGFKLLQTGLTNIGIDLNNDNKVDLQLFDRLDTPQTYDAAGVPKTPLGLVNPEFNRNHHIRLSGQAIAAEKIFYFTVRDNSLKGGYANPSAADKAALANAMAVSGLKQQAEEGSFTSQMDSYQSVLLVEKKKAAEKGIISKQTYDAWVNLSITLIKIKPQLPNAVDATLQAEAAKQAEIFYKSFENETQNAREPVNTGMGTSSYRNPYTGARTVTAPAYSNTTGAGPELAGEIKAGNWKNVYAYANTLEAGFDRWLVDRYKEVKGKHAKETQQAELLAGRSSALKDMEGKNAQKVNAVFNPDEKFKSESGYISQIPLALYYYKQGNTWYLKNITNPGNTYHHTVSAKPGEEIPPRELFFALNDPDHFPAGVIHYDVPGSYGGFVKTTDHLTWKKFFTYLGIGLAAAGITLATFGTGAVAAVGAWVLAGSAVAGAVSAGIDLVEHIQQGNLDATTAVLDIAQIVAGISGASALASGRIVLAAANAPASGRWAGAWARLAMFSDKIYLPAVATTAAADVVTFGAVTSATAKQLDEIENGAGNRTDKDRAKMLLLSQLAVAGGLTVLSVKGSLPGFKKGPNLVLHPGPDGVPVVSPALSIEQFAKNITSRINNSPAKGKFELKYSQLEIEQIVQKGRKLGLDEQTIEDLMLVGSRNEKRIASDELIKQMENYINVVKKNGFPYKFKSLDEFNSFKKDLKAGVEKVGVPTDDIRIQGSSLRTPQANDVDIAVFVDDTQFNDLLVNHFSGKAKLKSGTPLDLKRTPAELMTLAEDIKANPGNYNAQANTFQNAMLNRIISSKSDISKPLKEARKSISTKYSDLNVEAISIMTKKGNFDLQPYLKID